MNIVQKYPILGSSADPEKLALTVKGVLIAIIPLVLVLIRPLAPDFTENEAMEIINALFAVVAGVMIVWGLIRKAIVKFKK